MPVPQRLVTRWYRLSHRAFALAWRVFRPTTIGVKLIVTDRAGKVLLVRTRYLDAWALPGGGVHKRETPEDAAARELAEETGIAVAAGDLRLLGLLSSFAEGKSDYVAVFHGHLPAGSSPIPRGEIEAAAFFAPDGLPATASPATRRRLAEFVANSPMRGRW